jgi:alkylhydroperoxidase/carboxymuconolactone decarboxylase family protein YurZ
MVWSRAAGVEQVVGPIRQTPRSLRPGGGVGPRASRYRDARIGVDRRLRMLAGKFLPPRYLMATTQPTEDPERDPRVKAVFDDIRATRKTEFINNLWRHLAFDPPLLERTWAEVKAVMATPSSLDPLTKELLYIAVSIVNGCSYCVHSCWRRPKTEPLLRVVPTQN